MKIGLRRLRYLPVLALLFSWHACASDCVILLHGLARSETSMTTLAEALVEAEFSPVNYHYPSTTRPIAELAEQAISASLSQCPDTAGQIHFVTHSMGGIIVRQYLKDKAINKLGRVVMLGPPNKGSQVVDNLGNMPGFKFINGPAGMELGTGKLSVPNNLGPANFELGIIAGTRSINLILSSFLPNPNDGKVSVENTKLEGMADHISLPVTHPFMMKNAIVIKQVIYFLRHGSFNHRSLEH